MKSIEKFLYFTIIIGILLVLVGCGSTKSSEELIVGTWEYLYVHADGDESVDYYEFHDDGTMSISSGDSSSYRWYDWTIVDGDILKLVYTKRGDTFLYDINKISNKQMTLTERSDGEHNNWFSDNTATFTKSN